ncbi:hypothetical protein Bbelb_031390 [Branchiostoma belcheri]|nr:hypothetical protein Bbelb_031390 [Branchiostoma belcheri]
MSHHRHARPSVSKSGFAAHKPASQRRSLDAMESEFLQPGRSLVAEDGTAALSRFWLNLNSRGGLDRGLDQDKQDRPAEMPEILTFIVGSRSWFLPSKLLAVRLSLHSRKEASFDEDYKTR